MRFQSTSITCDGELQDADATVQIHTVRGVGYLLTELKA